MLEGIRTTWSIYRAIRTADKITPFLLPAFASFRGPEGKLGRKMQSDEFVLSYMYGAFLFMLEEYGVTDTLQKGFTLWKCYDKFFPREGKQVLNLCNSQVECKDKRFMGGCANGYKEMRDCISVTAKAVSAAASEREATTEIEESGVDVGWPSLRKHLISHRY